MPQQHLQIAKNFYGRIIGQGGSTIRQLESNYGVKIRIPEIDSPSTTVTVTGDNAQAVQECSEQIQAIIGNHSSQSQQQHPQQHAQSQPLQHMQPYSQPQQSQAPPPSQSSYSSPSPSAAQDNSTQGGGALSSLFSCISGLLGVSSQSNNSTSSSNGTSSFRFTGAGGQVDLRNISEVLFFPEDAGQQGHFDRFLALLRSATSTCDVAVYTISDDRISKALHTLHERGVKVRILTDATTINDNGSDIQSFADAGIPTHIAQTDANHLMHLKVAILDATCVLSGSFNWTRSASQGNVEDVICTSSPPLVSSFAQQFEKLWPRSQQLNAR